MSRRSSSWALFALVGAGGVGCRLELDTPVSYKDVSCDQLDVPVCQDATEHSDFTWIQKNILAKNCAGSACHIKGGTDKDAAKLEFTDDDDDPSNDTQMTRDVAYASLVEAGGSPIMSTIETDLPLVAKGTPNQSYLLFLMKAVKAAEFVPADLPPPPTEVGFMPRGNAILCCQKLDAVKRWVAAGAPND